MTGQNLLRCVVLEVRDRQQQVLGGNVFVLEVRASLKACSSSLLRGVRERGLGRFSGNFGKLFDFPIDLAENGLRSDADFFEHGRNDAFFVFEQGCEQVDRQKLGVAVLGGEVVCALDGFLRFDGEFVPTDGHGRLLFSNVHFRFTTAGGTLRPCSGQAAGR